jgi:hypothetical protein
MPLMVLGALQFFVLFAILLSSYQIYAGFVFISGDDSDDNGHCETATACSGYIVKILTQCISYSSIAGPNVKDVLAIGLTTSQTAHVAFLSYQAHLQFSYDIITSSEASVLSTVNFTKYKTIYLPSDEYDTYGGIPCSFLDILLQRRADIVRYVNKQGGSLSAFTQGQCGGSAYIWLPATFDYSVISINTLSATTYLTDIVPAVSSATLSHCCYHTKFEGPVGFNGLNVLATDPTDGG